MKEIRTAYTRTRVQKVPKGASRTRQEFKDDCDINNILKQFRRSGMITHRNEYKGQYGEFLAMDFHEAMNFVLETEEMFMTVPAQIRSRFNNDPAEFVDFVTNPQNQEEIYSMGLAERPVREAPGRAEPPPVAAPAAEE